MLLGKQSCRDPNGGLNLKSKPIFIRDTRWAEIERGRRLQELSKNEFIS